MNAFCLPSTLQWFPQQVAQQGPRDISGSSPGIRVLSVGPFLLHLYPIPCNWRVILHNDLSQSHFSLTVMELSSPHATQVGSSTVPVNTWGHHTWGHHVHLLVHHFWQKHLLESLPAPSQGPTWAQGPGSQQTMGEGHPCASSFPPRPNRPGCPWVKGGYKDEAETPAWEATELSLSRLFSRWQEEGSWWSQWEKKVPPWPHTFCLCKPNNPAVLQLAVLQFLIIQYYYWYSIWITNMNIE